MRIKLTDCLCNKGNMGENGMEIYRCLQERDVDKLISVQKAHVQAFKEKFIR